MTDPPDVPPPGRAGRSPADQPAGRQPDQPDDPDNAQRAGLTSRGKVRSTRVSALWIGLIIAAVLLVLLLIFIAQNSRDVTVRYLGLDGQVSLAVALLLSAVAGLLLVAIPGTARIIQLRRALKKNAGAHGTSRKNG